MAISSLYFGKEVDAKGVVKMTCCKQCQQYFVSHIREWFRFKGPYGYKVTEKVGKHSYKCVCNFCGYEWVSRAKDAAFQYNNPIEYKQRRDQIDKFYANLLSERERGYSVRIHPIKVKFGEIE